MNKIYLFIFCFLLFSSIQAQVQQGGTPYTSLNTIPELKTMLSFPEVDLDKLRSEDAIYDLQKNIPYRFGYNFTGNYNFNNSGEWINLKNGDRVWRVSFYSEGAQTLNFLLEKFHLAKGASIFFYNEDKSVVLGSFTEKNNRAHNNLSTMPIPGEKITVEFFEPASAKGLSSFSITRVTHGYRSLKIPTKAVDDAGDCNNNVICAVGDNWRDQIRSVGIIIVNGSGNCTGALVNNTCEDKTPYFLTADHCLGGDVTTWNIGFNWESADCSTNSGFQNISLESVNVLALRANDGGSDFALLELVQSPPSNFNVYFAGWDKSGDNPITQVGIHHPRGDLKKITFDTDGAGSATFGGAATWHVFDWEDGTTEPGSSGSPLFDQNKRIIGQLYGGTANCSNNVDDYYGKIDVSWNNGLSEFLDPLNLNPNTLDGLDGGTIISNDVTIEFLNKPTINNCGANIDQEILISNNGVNNATSISFEYGLDNNTQTYNWSGNLTQGQSETISFDKLILCEGQYNYTLEINTYNGSIDDMLCNNEDNFSFSVINGSNLEVQVKTNLQGSESSFEVYNASDELLFSENNLNDNELQTFNYCLAFGDYYFRMKDSGGNGLTATFFIDPGYYSINIDGEEIVNNDAFGSEEITNFNSDANGVLADFLNPDQTAGVSFNLLSNSSGNPQVFEWNAPNATITSETNIIFNTSFVNPGTYPVTLTISNDSACHIVVKNIRVLHKSAVGINELNNLINTSIYPNPTEGLFNINTKSFENTQLSLFNNIGQEVYKTELVESLTKIDVSNYNKGIYIVVLETNEHREIKKLVIK